MSEPLFERVGPTSDELRVYASLTQEQKRHLIASSAGEPGWLPPFGWAGAYQHHLPRFQEVSWGVHPKLPHRPFDVWWWIPLDTATILRAAAERVRVPERNAWEWLLFKGFSVDRVGAMKVLVSTWSEGGIR